MDSAVRAGDEAAEPADDGRGVRVADDDAGAKDGEAREGDAAHGVFFHAHDARVANEAAGGASDGGEQAELRDSGGVAAAGEGADEPSSRRFSSSSLQRAEPAPTPTQLTALAGPWPRTSRARVVVRSARSGAAVSRTTLRTRDWGTMGLRVIITTSRQAGSASSAATAALPTWPVPPRMIAAKFCVMKLTLLRGVRGNRFTSEGRILRRG